MIELYHCHDARSFRALWALEEMGLAYRLHLLPFPPRVLQPDYLVQNPLGTIPLMVDGDVRMTESAAIPQYLATRYGPTPLAVGVDEADYGLWLDWLHRSEATLTFPQTIVLRYTRLEPPERRATQAAEDYRKWFGSRLRAAATMTGERFACADRFTMADISFAYALKLAASLDMSDLFPARLVPYFEAMQARDGYQRALAAEHNAGIG